LNFYSANFLHIFAWLQHNHKNVLPCVNVGATRAASLDKNREQAMGSVVKKRRKKISKHKYRKRLKANRHKNK